MPRRGKIIHSRQVKLEILEKLYKVIRRGIESANLRRRKRIMGSLIEITKTSERIAPLTSRNCFFFIKIPFYNNPVKYKMRRISDPERRK